MAIALVAITVSLNDVIYATNTASIETLRPSRFEAQDALREVKREIAFARQANPALADFQAHVDRFTLNISKLLAARGIALGVNATDVESRAPALDNTTRVFYCGNRDRGGGNESGLRAWMRDLNISFTDWSFGRRCDTLVSGDKTPVATMFEMLCTTATCSGAGTELNASALVLEFDGLSAADVPTDDFGETALGIATTTGGFQWTPSSSPGALRCSEPPVGTRAGSPSVLSGQELCILQNWTSRGGILLHTGTSQTGTNGSVIDALTDETSPAGTSATWNGFSPGSTATVAVRRYPLVTAASGCLVNDTGGRGLMKNGANGSRVDFSRAGYVFIKGTDAGFTNHVSESPDNCAVDALSCSPPAAGAADPPCATAASWAYGSGRVHYIPHLQGELRTGARTIINEPDNLRPIFNLLPPGGTCRVGVNVTSGGVTQSGVLFC